MATITLDDPEMLRVLCAFLNAVRVDVHAAEGNRVTASIADAPSPQQERRELAAYLTTFNALNPGCTAALTD